MDRQLTVRKEGEAYHLIFHNYQGPAEGHQIGEVLELEEVEAPPGEHPETVPGVNKFFLWQPMSFHPDLHALVEPDRLERVADLVHRLYIKVVEGAEYLPDVPAAQAPSPGVQAAATPSPTPAEHISFTEEMEKRHESVWKRGPAAVTKALILRLVPLILLVLVAIIIHNHTGDHYRSVEMDEAFRQAGRTPVEQGFWGRLWKPDFSHQVRFPLRSAEFAEGSLVVTRDGEVLHFEGVDDVRGLLKRASRYSGLPELECVAEGGEVRIQRFKAGGDILLQHGSLVLLDRLPRSQDKPVRVPPGNENGFQEYSQIGLEDDSALLSAGSRRVSFEGVVEEGDSGLVLRFANGAGVRLETRGAQTPVDRLLDLFAGRPHTIVVDGVLSTVYPPVSRLDPAHSREGSGLIGELSAYSASAQKYHAVDRR
jgi:hypothetical protein